MKRWCVGNLRKVKEKGLEQIYFLLCFGRKLSFNNLISKFWAEQLWENKFVLFLVWIAHTYSSSDKEEHWPVIYSLVFTYLFKYIQSQGVGGLTIFPSGHIYFSTKIWSLVPQRSYYKFHIPLYISNYFVCLYTLLHLWNGYFLRSRIYF